MLHQVEFRYSLSPTAIVVPEVIVWSAEAVPAEATESAAAVIVPVPSVAFLEIVYVVAPVVPAFM